MHKEAPFVEKVRNWEQLSLKSAENILPSNGPRLLGRILIVVLFIIIIIMMLPWRQTIPGRGTVTALRPQDRPQTVQNQIGGRIERWAVREGQEVKKGDTILVLSDINQSYFDPELPDRPNEQLSAKRGSEDAAGKKIQATNAQLAALSNG